jgi:lipopolysaccharide transport system ATP-binding protein
MATPAIRIEGLGKRYRVGGYKPYRSLREALTSAALLPVRAVRRDGTNGSGSRARDHIWALRDVSLDIQPGEIVGVVGRNGAGKSTLLKIVSRVTEPTEGEVELWGRVGSLLEVGTGFHHELSGRENIFLSGAILGMTRREIQRKFDEIVEFAELERFIDTPVKRYSSGMFMRLGFAVAAHLESEILLVDEVLAVGDADFQKRCLGKIDDVAGEGRTVFFVSHNMTSVNRLCTRAVMLTDGRLVADGPSSDVVARYLRTGTEENGERTWRNPLDGPGNEKIRLAGVRISSQGTARGLVDIDQSVSIEVEYWNLREGSKNLGVSVQLLDAVGNIVFATSSTPHANALEEEWFARPRPIGLYRSTLEIPANFLNAGRYHVSVYVVSFSPTITEAQAAEVVAFDVFDTGVMREPGASGTWPGAVRPRLPWITELVERRAP